MTAKNIRKGDTSVTISGKVIDIGLPIQQALDLDDLLILRMDDYELPSDDPFNGRNVTALDPAGNEVWRIEPFWHKVTAKDGRRVPSSYGTIHVGGDGKLYVYHPIGFMCEIDVKTGNILHEEPFR